MRITHQMYTDQILRSMDENMQRLSAAQQKTLTGKSFQRASDNPVAAGKVLTLRHSLSQAEAYQAGAKTAADWLTASESAVQGLSDLATKAINHVLRGLSDSYPDNRQAIAEEVDEVLQQALDFGNTKLGNEYIFSGFQSNMKTFEYNGTAVTYMPTDNSSIQREIGRDQQVTINVDGEAVIQPFFDSLIAAREALRAEDMSALSAALGGLQTAAEGIKSTHGQIGGRQNQVQKTGESLENIMLQLKGLISDKEDANLAEAITELSQSENTYKTVLEVSSRTLALTNLFSLLR